MVTRSKISLSGDEMVVKDVICGQKETSARVYLPKSWKGRKVACLLLHDEVDVETAEGSE